MFGIESVCEYRQERIKHIGVSSGVFESRKFICMNVIRIVVTIKGVLALATLVVFPVFVNFLNIHNIVQNEMKHLKKELGFRMR